ncbi:MAG: hypothetical protein GY852_08795 [bacterium]|nr:hypothetical protein [bacterium]
MAPPSRKELKKSMLNIFLSKDEAEKKKCSREFTKLLFKLVESKMPGKDEDEIYMKQMEAIGLFSQYIFRKTKEKAEETRKAQEKILKEISEESDELFEEIEAVI